MFPAADDTDLHKARDGLGVWPRQGFGRRRHRPRSIPRRDLHRRARRAGVHDVENVRAILPTVRNGKLRGVAVTSLKRSPSSPACVYMTTS